MKNENSSKKIFFDLKFTEREKECFHCHTATKKLYISLAWRGIVALSASTSEAFMLFIKKNRNQQQLNAKIKWMSNRG